VRGLLKVFATLWIFASLANVILSIGNGLFLARWGFLPWSNVSSIAVDSSRKFYVYSDLYEQVFVYDLVAGGRFVGSIPGMVRKGPAGLGATTEGHVVLCSGNVARFVSRTGEGKEFKSDLDSPDWRYDSGALTPVPKSAAGSGSLASTGEVVCSPSGFKSFAIGNEVEASISYLGIASVWVEGKKQTISAPWYSWLMQSPFPAPHIGLLVICWIFWLGIEEGRLPIRFDRRAKRAP